MPNPCLRHLQNRPARPQHVSTTSCQAGFRRERTSRQAEQGLRMPPLTLLLPHQSQTCHLSGRRPPSLQGHLTKATMPNESVMPSSLSSGAGTARRLAEQVLRALCGQAPTPLKSKPYHFLGLQQEELLIPHLQALVQAPSPHRELSLPFRYVMHHFLQEVLLPPRPQTSLYLLPQIGVLDPFLEPQPPWTTFTWQR